MELSAYGRTLDVRLAGLLRPLTTSWRNLPALSRSGVSPTLKSSHQHNTHEENFTQLIISSVEVGQDLKQKHKLSWVMFHLLLLKSS